MDIIFIILVVVGLVVRSIGRKQNNKDMEKIGSIVVVASALILTTIWGYSCIVATP